MCRIAARPCGIGEARPSLPRRVSPPLALTLRGRVRPVRPDNAVGAFLVASCVLRRGRPSLTVPYPRALGDWESPPSSTHRASDGKEHAGLGPLRRKRNRYPPRFNPVQRPSGEPEPDAYGCGFRAEASGAPRSSNRAHGHAARRCTPDDLRERGWEVVASFGGAELEIRVDPSRRRVSWVERETESTALDLRSEA